jgi:hypothetical protein
MLSTRTRIVLCFTIVILIGVPALLIAIKGGWFYPRIREFKVASAIILSLIAVLSIALCFLCRAGRRASVFAFGFTAVWVVLLLPETQYYLDTRNATADSIVEPFYRQYETIGYVMASSQANHLTMRWSERRTAVRSTLEMISTPPPQATRALVRRRSSYSR